MQHVALIFCEICTTFEAQSTVGMRTNPRMVSSSDRIESELIGSLHKSFEFEVPVAFDTWVGGDAALVSVDVRLHDVLVEFF
jgi:hypothetical protein